MSDDTELLDALHDLAQHLDWPDPALDVTTLAITRVLPPRPRRLLVAAGIAAALVVAVSAVPSTREAVAELLGLGGVRITLRGDVPADLDGTLALGRPVTLEEARRLAPGPLPLPAGIDDPSAAYAGEPVSGVTLAWAPSEALPAVLDHGVGLLVTAFPGRVDRYAIEKQVPSDATIERTTVEGAPAYWVMGTHVFVYLDEDGTERLDTTRLSGNALVWTNGDVTYRLESALSRTEAVRLAESIAG